MRKFASVAATASLFALQLIGAGAAAADVGNSCGPAATNGPLGRTIHSTIATRTDKDWFRFTPRTNSRVLIDLGGLRNNFSLQLYNSACHMIASSDHGGPRFEELYRNLAAGKYFVRVAGVNRATGSYDVRFRPLRYSVFGLSSRSYIDSIGELHIPGEVLNNTSAYRQFVEVDATYYNKSNRVIGTDFTYANADTLAPWHRAPFELLHDRMRGFDHYRLTVSSDRTSNRPVGRLLVRQGVPSTDSIGERHFPGEVHNRNRFKVHYVEVDVVLYGSHGEVRYTDFSFTNPDTVQANATAPYDVEFDSPSGVNGYATYVQGQR